MKKIKERNSAVELLRIILMFFVIGCHVLGNGVLNYKSPLHTGDTNFYYAMLMESIFCVAVNCFILISGYYLINADVKKLARLYSQVFSYSIGLTFIFSIGYALTGKTINPLEILKSFLPVISERWWFFTYYIILFLLSPYLNKLINYWQTPKRGNGKVYFFPLIVILLFFFSIAPSLSFVIQEPQGFNIVHFVMLYLIGAYCKQYIVFKRKWCVAGYVISTFGIMIYACLLDLLGYNIGWSSASFSYDNLLVILSSCFLFGIFITLKIHSTYINWLSGLVFGVYLLHENKYVKPFLYTDILHCDNYYHSNLFILHTIVALIVIFIAGIIIEYLRVKLLAKFIDRLFLRIFSKIFHKYNIFE